MHACAILISIEMKARQKMQTLRQCSSVCQIVLMIRDMKIAILKKLEMFYIFARLVSIYKKGYTQFDETLDQTSL